MLAGSGKRSGAIAPSKLSCPVAVPATPLTLTAVRTAAVLPYACGAHATVVADVHALLPHTSAAVSEAVAVGPTAPKLSPPIVTVPPPLGAAFAETVLTTGAASISNVPHDASGSRAAVRRIAPSKLSCPVTVPATPLTLTAVRTPPVPPYACGAHLAVVADVHALLPHVSAAVSEAVADAPAAPKLKPLIVTVPPAVGAAFAVVALATGAASATLQTA